MLPFLISLLGLPLVFCVSGAVRAHDVHPRDHPGSERQNVHWMVVAFDWPTMQLHKDLGQVLESNYASNTVHPDVSFRLQRYCHGLGHTSLQIP